MKLYSVLIGIFLTGAIHIAHADLQGPTQQLCERVKTCAYENLALDSSNAGNQAMLEMLFRFETLDYLERKQTPGRRPSDLISCSLGPNQNQTYTHFTG